MCSHSCAQLDLFTRISPEDGDEWRDLHSPARVLLYSFVRAVAGRCSRRGAGWLHRRSFCGRTLPELIGNLNRMCSIGVPASDGSDGIDERLQVNPTPQRRPIPVADAKKLR